jgi:hypothetical protein
MRKDKKREKKGIPPFFLHTINNSWKKKNSLPLPIPLNKTPLFFKFTKTPLRDEKSLNIVLSSPNFFF